MKLILASQSPRRQELLKLFHIPFTVQVSDIDETMDGSKSAYDEVARISRKKAEAACRGDMIITGKRKRRKKRRRIKPRQRRLHPLPHRRQRSLLQLM